MQVHAHEVEPGTINDIAITWAHGEEHHFVAGTTYADLAPLIDRIFWRLGREERALVRPFILKTRELVEPGNVARCVMGSQHYFALMRPYVLTRQGAEPFIVCRGETSDPKQPVLCGSREEAREYVREVKRRTGISTRDWCGYAGGRERTPFEDVMIRAVDGRRRLPTDLEDALANVRHAERLGHKEIKARRQTPSEGEPGEQAEAVEDIGDTDKA